METKEAEVITVIANKDQLLDAYPDLFEEIPFGITKIHIERLFNDRLLSNDGRIVMLPGGVVSVKAEEEEMKNLHKNDTEFFTQLNTFVGKFQDKYMDDDSIDLTDKLEINDTTYNIAFFPYKDINAGENLMSRIEPKLSALEGKP